MSIHALRAHSRNLSVAEDVHQFQGRSVGYTLLLGNSAVYVHLYVRKRMT